MAPQYRIRVGIRAELYLTLIANSANLPEQELLRLVRESLKKHGDDEGGFPVEELPEGAVYPEYNSVDRELEPDKVLDPDMIRVFDVAQDTKIE